MTDYFLLGISSILIAGIGAQWLAWRFKWPSIVLLLAIGFVAGPVTQLVRPDQVLGPLLIPMVSISVAIILFEGGLSLSIRELKKIGQVVFNLVSIGVIVHWAIIALAARYILGLHFVISILLAAILVVTGPTVIIPLLRHVRPTGRVGSILRWEGIVIDPIGAALTVLVYEYIIVGQNFGTGLLLFFLKSVVVGTISGALGAWILLVLLRKYWIPDFLHGTATLMFVIAVFIIANFFHHESGLFAAIAMGIILGNQNQVAIQHIVRFKENLGILIISTLFIILSARLNLHDLGIVGWSFAGFLAVLIFIARPLSVFVSTINSGLTFKEKLFIAWMAPRGIVAAAIVSVFAFKLAEAGIPQADFLVPVTFLVIIGTVVIYGVSSLWVAQRLNLAQTHAQGVLILGANRWARLFAKELKAANITVKMIDSNIINITNAQNDGIEAYEENILTPDIEEKIDLSGVGRLLALTGNDEANSLAVLHFIDIFGRSEVYQLYPSRRIQSQVVTLPPSLRGRYLFDQNLPYDVLHERSSREDVIKSTVVMADCDNKAFVEMFGANAVALCAISEKNELRVFTPDVNLVIKKGEKVIYLAA